MCTRKLLRATMATLEAAPPLRTAAASAIDVPTAKGLPLIGNLLTFLRAGGATCLHKYVHRQHAKHGAVFRERLGAVDAIFVADADVMRAVFAQEGRHPVHVLPEAWTLYNQLNGCARGLFFMNGEEWLHHRRIMNQLLLLKSGDGTCDFISDAVEHVADAFDVGACETHLEEALYVWSLETIVAILMGVDDYAALRPQLHGKLVALGARIKLIFETTSKLQFLPVKWARTLNLRIWREFVCAVDDALRTSSDLVYELMGVAGAGSGRGGLLRAMRAAGMSTSDTIKIVVDLVLAAGDTTAYTMQWMLYALARHPQYQDSIADEGNVKHVVRETLRLYPVAPFLTRINVDHDIVAKRFRLPRGSLIIYSLYTAGRDGTVFSQPDAFLPERWQRERRTPAMAQTALPFAIGARACVGRRIAELQLATTVRHVCERYRIALAAMTPLDVDIALKMISVPATPIRLRFIKK